MLTFKGCSTSQTGAAHEAGLLDSCVRGGTVGRLQDAGPDVASVAFAPLQQRARNPDGSEVIVVTDIESRSPLES